MATVPSTARLLKCIVVSPEKALLDAAAEYVILPMYDGELGVWPGRAPLIGRLGAGELRYAHGGRIHRFFVDGGFAQVRDNVVTVLTAKALKAEEINPEKAREDLAAAQGIAATPEAQEAQLKIQDRARAQLRLAEKVRGGAGGHA
jgi:F-type H+-transporting ATPase subunit epsilon